MLISVLNRTNGNVSDAELGAAIRAINRQIDEDFGPRWNRGGRLRAGDVGAEAVIHLSHGRDDAALGEHEALESGMPFGTVSCEISEALDEPWSKALSREALSMLADPYAALLAPGPKPDDASEEVLYWLEPCDPVQSDAYEVDGVAVSSFVLPSYFARLEGVRRPKDFLGNAGSRSFGIAPGGFVGFFDPRTNRHEIFGTPGDTAAERRVEVLVRAGRRTRTGRRQRVPSLETVRRAVLGLPPGQEMPEPTFQSFTIALRPEGSRSLAAALATLERAAAAAIGPRWSSRFRVEHQRVRDDAADTVEVDLVPETSTVVGVGEAWDITYELRRQAGVESAAPNFSYVWIPPDLLRRMDQPSGASDFFVEENHPGTDGNFEWSIDQIGVREAWSVSPARGQNVLIGHPDTGYHFHPELVGENGSASPIRLDIDRDFVGLGHDDDALANLDDLDILGGPKHGTTTGSVIVSPEGKQSNTYEGFVTGVAPGAELVPLRVQRHVAHFSWWNLRQSIDYAVDIGCHVISMSLGGPLPDLFLERSFRNAVDEGVVLLAAAGNYVGFVTYPAAYDDVIAVAACDFAREPWSGSSHGPKVEVTAPGAGVWTAVPAGSSVSTVYLVERGSGTSHAVAHAAGVVALWLAHHGRDQLIAAYGKRGMVQVCRHLLRNTAKPPGNGWDTSEYGGGIIDAKAFLEEPLPASVPAPAVLGPTAAIDRVFPGVPAEMRRAGVEALVGADEEVSEELAFHLAIHPELSERLELGHAAGVGAAVAGASLRRRLREVDVSRRLARVLSE